MVLLVCMEGNYIRYSSFIVFLVVLGCFALDISCFLLFFLFSRFEGGLTIASISTIVMFSIGSRAFISSCYLGILFCSSCSMILDNSSS